MKALAPHRGALLALALFLVVGLAILDDYGVASDEPLQRQTARATLGYLANGDLDAFLANLSHRHNKFYGMAFEAPIQFFIVRRALGLEGGRSVWLFRHTLIHIFHLAGGFFAYLLARRLLGARLLALLAMLLFLLHPRLYAHSFFNSKVKGGVLAHRLVAFIMQVRALRQRVVRIALRRSIARSMWQSEFSSATRRASRSRIFRSWLRSSSRSTWRIARSRGTRCLRSPCCNGVGVGIAVNLRIMGVVLLAAIPALRALDLAFTPSWRERERILLSIGAFALASLLTIYALLPYLWADPIARAVEWWTTLSDHPYKPYALFRGSLGRSVDFPEYVTTWFSITSPPFALLLGLVGAALLLFWSAKSPRKAWGNCGTRGSGSACCWRAASRCP